MELQIDREAGAAYLKLSDNKVEATGCVSPTINIDYDEDGEMVGIEFLTIDWLDNPTNL